MKDQLQFLVNHVMGTSNPIPSLPSSSTSSSQVNVQCPTPPVTAPSASQGTAVLTSSHSSLPPPATFPSSSYGLGLPPHYDAAHGSNVGNSIQPPLNSFPGQAVSTGGPFLQPLPGPSYLYQGLSTSGLPPAPPGENAAYPLIPIAPPSSAPNPLHSITIQVSEKAKAKIYADQYVDFTELLSPLPNAAATSSLPTSSTPVTGGAATTTETPRKKWPISERAWFKAFFAFQAIRNSRFPQEAPQLINYGHHIASMMDEGQDWRRYDQDFRLERQSKPLRWDDIHVLIFAKATVSKATAAPTPASGSFRPSDNSSDIPKGYCYGFHHPHRQCPDPHNCTFKHSCPSCGGEHTLNRHKIIAAKEKERD